MLNHYIVIALRNLMKKKLNTFIKVVGLALGLVAVLLTAIVNFSELTWDSFWRDADNIYMLRTEPGVMNGMRTLDYVQEADFIKMRSLQAHLWLTEIDEKPTSVSLVVDGKAAPSQQKISVIRVDPDFLDIFQPNVISGDVGTFAQNPDAAFISQSVATILFGSDNPLGKTLLFPWGGESWRSQGDATPQMRLVTIIAVVDIDNPRSHINPGLFFPKLDYPQLSSGDAAGISATYIKSKTKKSQRDIAALVNQAIEEMPGRYASKNTYELMAIGDRHLNDTSSEGNRKRIYILTLVALTILIIAVSNFINLSLAGYVARQKEVALRRIHGAWVSDLVWQYWIETLLYVSLSGLLALIMVELISPHLKNFLEIPLVETIFVSPMLASLCAAFFLLIALIIALYPAVYFSRLNAATILKANRSVENRISLNTRRVLLTIQFTMISVLMVGIATVILQMKIISQYNPGYKTHDILMLINQSDTPPAKEKMAVIKRELASIPSFVAASVTIGDIPGRQEQTMMLGSTIEYESRTVNVIFDWVADQDYFATFGIDFVAGGQAAMDAAFVRNRQGDSEMDVILCRTTAAKLGYKTPEDALGRSIDLFKKPNDIHAPSPTGKIIAVVNDIHLGSHKKPPLDCMFAVLDAEVMNMPFAINFSNPPASSDIDAIRKLWEKFSGAPPHHWMFSGSLSDRYKNEQRIQFIILSFTFAAMILGVLGIYGITALDTQKRTREIAMRKLYGANKCQLIFLLSRKVAYIAALANFIAWPFAIYVCSRWLENFHEHFAIQMWLPIFCVGALVMCLFMVGLTVSGHSLAISRLRPAEALRDE